MALRTRKTCVMDGRWMALVTFGSSIATQQTLIAMRLMSIRVSITTIQRQPYKPAKITRTLRVSSLNHPTPSSCHHQRQSLRVRFLLPHESWLCFCTCFPRAEFAETNPVFFASPPGWLACLHFFACLHTIPHDAVGGVVFRCARITSHRCMWLPHPPTALSSRSSRLRAFASSAGRWRRAPCHPRPPESGDVPAFNF
jgi:hypothetical protein